MQATLSHYRVLEEIGKGGMGVIYRAHDEHLDCDVALKVLPAGELADDAARKRFRKEALALSKVHHPNIAIVHDFDTQDGTDFLIEELIPGLSLSEILISGPLPEREIINLGSQLCEGLAAAHEQGVLHRDLKPGNIRVTPDARLKLLDFGLAKVLHTTAPGSDTAATASLTETQTVSGTFPYMAPEQLLNEKLDARSDIWSAGCVLYEMATGQRPFLGYGPTLIDAILHQPPATPLKLNHKISPGLEAIILKCLEKDPGLRYGSAREVAVDLHRLVIGSMSNALAARRRSAELKLGAVALAIVTLVAAGYGLYRWMRSPTAEIRSIAVLPLANLAGDSQQEYFTDGMTEALITDLSRISTLRVISRTSVMRYKNTRQPLSEIAHDLGVDAVVEGSVLRVGDRVRITAQLIRVHPEQHLWANSYDRELRNVLALHRDVAQAIAGEVRAKIGSHERARVAAVRPIDPEAYDNYLKGRYYWNQRTKLGLKQGLEYFQRAIDRDPTYARAYVGVADAYAVLGSNGVLAPEDVFPKARAAALKALELDDTLAEAHATLGVVARHYDWDWVGAEKEFRAAIQLDPSYASAHQWYGHFLAFNGRLDEAMDEFERARLLDPLSPRISVTLAAWAAEDKSVVELNKTAQLFPTDGTPHVYLALAYLFKGQYDSAVAEIEMAKRLGDLPETDIYLGYIYAVAGRKTEALRTLNQWKELSRHEYVPPTRIALIYVGLGEKEQALQWLETAYEKHDSNLVYLTSRTYALLRSDTRFQELLSRLNLSSRMNLSR